MTRTEQEMMDLILDRAKTDDLIRAVVLNGSRANPKISKDIFQDFDIVYLVTDLVPFINDHSWIKVFGEVMIFQMPKNSALIPEPDDGTFTYLMQFMDGNRIDLSLVPITMKDEVLKSDGQRKLLVDKDHIYKDFPDSSDIEYIVKPPTGKQFDDCCNEFWWMCPYVAKGIWREELPYAMGMYEYTRGMLFQLVKWSIGISTNYSISVGKQGKYFKKYLKPKIWERLVRTYSRGEYDDLWESLFEACAVFTELASEVAKYFGFNYPSDEYKKVEKYLKHIKDLPKDAKSIYQN